MDRLNADMVIPSSFMEDYDIRGQTIKNLMAAIDKALEEMVSYELMIAAEMGNTPTSIKVARETLEKAQKRIRDGNINGL